MRKTFITGAAALLMAVTLQAQDHSRDTTHAQQLAWWKQQRFGMFIHWGPVSLRGQEISWSRGAGIPTAEYDDLYKQFNPTGFNAGEWVRIAKSAGMKYMVFVAKHHDGFCEFNTALTNYSIMSPQSPFRRDVTKELTDSAHALGMGIGLYYSPTDFYAGDNGSAAYLDYYQNQVVDELLSHYGRIETIWWDLGPIGANGPALLERMRRKQPWILVNNRGDHSSMGDYATPEQKIGAFDTLHTWESCMTIDGSNQWAWNPNGGLKPLRQLIDMIVGTADGGGNCLLNVGPRPDGVIDPPMAARLREIGGWMARYGESIYGTVGGPMPGGPWGGATHRGDTLYLHLKPFAGSVTIPGFNATVVSATSLSGGTPTLTQTALSLKITLPAKDIDTLYTVLKLIINPAKPVEILRNVALGATATQSSTAYGGSAERAVDGNTDGQFFDNSVTHTDSAAGSWWQVDLGAVYPVSYVRVFNRTDEQMSRLGNYNVILLDANSNPVWTGNQMTYPDPSTTIEVGKRSARYVKIQLAGAGYLSLAEVQVLLAEPGSTRLRMADGGAGVSMARKPVPGASMRAVFRRGEGGRTYDAAGGSVKEIPGSEQPPR